MTVIVRAVQKSLPTSGITTDITISGIGTPTAAIFFATRATVNGTAVDGAAMSYGFTDGTNEFCCCCYAEHGQTTADSGSATRTSCITLLDDTGGFDGEFPFNTWITDGVRLTVSNAPSQSWIVTVIFFCGDEVSAHVGEFVSPAVLNGTIDVTDPGFEPSLVVTATTAQSANDSTQVGAHFYLGMSENPGSNKAVNFHSADNTANTELAQFCTSSTVHKFLFARAVGALSGERVQLASYDADGFTAQTLDLARAGPVRYLALDFGTKNVTVETKVIPASTTGDVTIDVSESIRPQVGFGFMSSCPSTNTMEENGDGGAMGAFVFTLDEEFCSNFSMEEGIGTSDTQCLTDNTAMRLELDDGTAGYEASFVSFDVGEAVINVGTADSSNRIAFFVFIEEDFREVFPGVGELELDAPVPVVGVGIDIAVAAAPLELGSLAPDVALGINIEDAAAPLELGDLAPVVGVGVDFVDAASSLELGSIEPTVVFSIVILDDAAPLELGDLAPLLEVGTGILAAAAPLVLDAPAPTIGIVIALPAGSLVLDAPIILVGVSVDFLADTGELALGLLEPTVSNGIVDVVVVASLGSLVLRQPESRIVNGTQFFFNRKRIQNALIEAGQNGVFMPVIIDPNSGLMGILDLDYDQVAPLSVLADEIASQASEPRRNRQTGRRERTTWRFELYLVFAQAVSVEVFEKDIAANVPVLPRNELQGLQQVRLNWLDTRYEHPPLQNSTSGTRATLSFEAVLSPI